MRHGFNPWVGKIPWRKRWQPTPVFLPGESHGTWQATVHKVAKSEETACTHMSNVLDTRLRRRRNILRPKLLPRWDYDQRGNMINKQIDITNYGKWLEEDSSVNSIIVSLSYSLLCLGRWFSDRDKWWYSSHLKQSMARLVRTQGSTQRVGAFQRNGIFKLVKVVFFENLLK